MKLTPKSKILIYGITEPRAIIYLKQMKDFGTNIIAGISPGSTDRSVEGIPIFNLVEEAINKVGMIDTALIFISAISSKDATLECLSSGIKQIILLSPTIPPIDMMILVEKAKQTNSIILGPGSSGLIIPKKLLLGTLTPKFYTLGSVGIISRCTTLTDEIAAQLTKTGLGQSIVISLGRGAILGSTIDFWLDKLYNDEKTQSILLLDQINNPPLFINTNIKKPLIAYIAGQELLQDNSPPENDIIVAKLSGLISDPQLRLKELTNLAQSGILISDRPSNIANLIKKTNT